VALFLKNGKGLIGIGSHASVNRAGRETRPIEHDLNFEYIKGHRLLGGSKGRDNYQESDNRSEYLHQFISLFDKLLVALLSVIFSPSLLKIVSYLAAYAFLPGLFFLTVATD
jgi:hypothetical protein